MKYIWILLCCSFMSGAMAENASKWGFDPKDATACLQKAIDSGARKIVVDNTGSEWLVGPIALRSDLELVFADGVVVRALPGAFKGRNDCLFQAWDAANITIRGEGNAVLKMNKADYQDESRYQHSEWRNSLSLRGCENVVIRDLKLEGSGGDGIYVSTGRRTPGCRNITIENVIAVDHHRQGISIISVDGLRIKNCQFNNTSGTAPAAGIDFEPNSADEWIADCVIENTVFKDNVLGVCISVGVLTANSKPVSVQFRDCRFDGGAPVLFSIASRTVTPVKGSVVFERCEFTGAKSGVALINNLLKGGFEMKFKDCILDNRGAQGSAIQLSSSLPVDFGGLTFEGTTLKTGNKPAFGFANLSGGGLSAIGGDLKLQQANGAEKNFNFEAFIAANQANPELLNFKTLSLDPGNLKPLAENGRNAVSKRFRGKFKLLQYVETNKPLTLKFKAKQVSKAPLNILVEVKDAVGTPVDQFRITEPEFSYDLKTSASGIRLFEINTGGQTLELASGHPGQAVWVDTRTGMFVASGAEFYFLVPAGVETVKVEVMPDVGEPVAAALISPDGKTAAASKPQPNLYQLSAIRRDASKAEIWKLRFPYVREDFRFRLGAPLPPLVSTAPENILVQK